MNSKKFIGLGLIALLGIVLVVLLWDRSDEGVIKPLTESWEQVVPHQEIPEGLNSLSSEDCGACHQAHYEEWKTSTHANAWTDMQFQAELKKESSPFFCINCHIPLQNQQEYIVDGYIDGDLYQPHKRKNPNWDRKLQQEGVNCASCHVRGGAIVGPTGTKKAPHNTVKDPKFLSETLCINCHNTVAIVTPELTCTFETGDEWSSGPYAESQNCIACHMEEVKREVVPGFGERKSHLHYFSGSGIPKHSSLKATILSGLEFYPDELKSKISVNETLKYNFKLKNEHAGHKVPTGDPERFILVTMKLFDEENNLVKEQTDRIGENWEWYPKAKKLSDNNLNPHEERTYEFNWKGSKKGDYRLVVEVTKHRMDQKTADYNKLTEEYPIQISIYEKEYHFTVN